MRTEASKTMPQMYELRINGKPVKRSANVVDLHWDGRVAVCGTTHVAEVETVQGSSYVCAFYTDNILAKWEREGAEKIRAEEAAS